MRLVEMPFLPIGARPVDPEDRLLDIVRASKVVDGPSAVNEGAVIVDHNVSPIRHLVVETLQGLHGGFIHVAIQPKDGDLMHWRNGERVLEPSVQEADLVIQELVALEIGFHRFDCAPPGRG